MLKRPSSRRKSTQEGITLNLVPLIDSMVTLIGFLLFTISFLNFVSIETPFPEASTHDVEEKLKEKPLQLTVSIRENETEIWSPFEKVKAQTIKNIGPGLPDTKAIHDALVGVKQQFPAETKIVIAPFSGTAYDVLISVMDSMRLMDPADPAIFRKNEKTGVDEAVKILFPDVIFGNLLGDA